MNRHGIGAVLVVNGRGLEGILTERDVMQRVVEPGRDPAATRVDEVMTRRPRTAALFTATAPRRKQWMNDQSGAEGGAGSSTNPRLRTCTASRSSTLFVRSRP